MSDDEASGRAPRKLGSRWLLAAVALVAVVATLLGVVLILDDDSTSTGKSVAPPAGVNPAAGDATPDVSIQSAERPEDGRWIVSGVFAPSSGSASTAAGTRGYDLYVVAETDTGRYVSDPATFESDESWRARFPDPIAPGSVTFLPGTFVQQGGGFGGPRASSQALGARDRRRLQSGGARVFDRAGPPFVPSQQHASSAR